MNNDENYNSENDSDYSSSVEDSNCDSENDSDKNDSISSSMQKTSRIINVIISQIIQINFTAAQFLIDHNQEWHFWKEWFEFSQKNMWTFQIKWVIKQINESFTVN